MVMRVTFIFPLLAAFSLLPLLIHNNHQVRQLRKNITYYESVIDREEENLALLRLEMSRLTHPERIHQLSKKWLPHLGVPKHDQIYIVSRDQDSQRMYDLHRILRLSDQSFFKGEQKIQ